MFERRTAACKASFDVKPIQWNWDQSFIPQKPASFDGIEVKGNQRIASDCISNRFDLKINMNIKETLNRISNKYKIPQDKLANIIIDFKMLSQWVLDFRFVILDFRF